MRPMLSPYVEDDPEFRGFIESVTLSAEELAAFVACPELTISDVKTLFTEGRLSPRFESTDFLLMESRTLTATACAREVE